MKKLVLLLIVSMLTVTAFPQKSNQKPASKKVQSVTIQTNGVCKKCADRFNENVPYFKGVKTCNYDMKTAKLTINYDPAKTSPEQLRKEVSKLGYNADDVKADQSARAKLPPCCRSSKAH